MPPIYCISLARAKERRAAMHESLSVLGLPFEIVDAVDGRTLDLSSLGGRLRQDIARRHYGQNLSCGEIGCYLSHYNLWQRMVDENISVAVILEDDVQLLGDFKNVLAGVLNKSNAADIILFNLPPQNYGGDLVWKIDETYKVVRPKKRVLTNVAYLINLAGAHKLLDDCYTITKPIDMHGWEYWRNGLALYCVEPQIAYQKEVPSIINEGDVNRKAVLIFSFTSEANLWERICASCYRKRRRWAMKRYQHQNPVPKIMEKA